MYKKGLRLSAILAMALCATFLLTAALAAGRDAPEAALWVDDFDSPALNGRWSWEFEDPAFWSLTARPGFLRITTQSELRNVLVQNPPAGDYTIETHVYFTPTSNFQHAGLMVWQDADNLMTLIRAYCDLAPPAPCVGNGIYFDHVEGGMFIEPNYAMTVTSDSEAYLRLVKVGAVYSGYVSVDNVNWQFVGAHTAGFVPTGIGLHSGNNIDPMANVPSDYDYFRLLADYPYELYLPVILNP